jgi:hypothetical protein
MDNDNRIRTSSLLYNRAVALRMTVRAIRRAQGKNNPGDVARGTPAWEAVAEDFLRDLHRAMGGDPDDLDEAG